MYRLTSDLTLYKEIEQFLRRIPKKRYIEDFFNMYCIAACLLDDQFKPIDHYFDLERRTEQEMRDDGFLAYDFDFNDDYCRGWKSLHSYTTQEAYLKALKKISMVISEIIQNQSMFEIYGKLKEILKKHNKLLKQRSK